ncbi:PH domain-containing protein [Streptococcus suis]|uniref:PH domain-containing protein n=1 Tax=Streptococcus suis TaxID=1307 RepID=UPI003D76998A
MALNLGKIAQGLAGNFSQQSNESLYTEYSQYLLDEEVIQNGYVLIRDAVIFTNIRIIFVDKQGATGKKTAIKSIFLSTLVHVEMETAGFGLDDSEITITYLRNIYLKSKQEELVSLKLEFPKQTDIIPLYKYLLELAYQNRLSINNS